MRKIKNLMAKVEDRRAERRAAKMQRDIRRAWAVLDTMMDAERNRRGLEWT